MKNKRLIEALSYLRYCAKHGSWEAHEIDGMSSTEIILYAEKMRDRAEYMATL